MVYWSSPKAKRVTCLVAGGDVMTFGDGFNFACAIKMDVQMIKNS